MSPLSTPVADPGTVRTALVELLGPDRVSPEGEPVVVRPIDDDQVSAILRRAGEEGWRVLPTGAGRGAELRPVHGGRGEGVSPAEPDLRISSLDRAALLDHEPADLTVQAEAGLGLGALQNALSEHHQWLALDPPGGAGITLGGIVATGTAGPLRLLYGRPRDQLLGLTLVDGAGRILELGGRVVKNVAGFDLVRLAAGSRGTLGVVTRVTFRLYPRPEADRTLVWSLETPGKAWAFGRELATLPLPLAAAVIVAGGWEAPLDDPGSRVVLRLSGSSASVDRMRDLLLERAGLPFREHGDEVSGQAWAALSAGDGEGEIALRVQTLPDRVGTILPILERLPVERLAGQLLQGTVRATLAAGSDPARLASLAEAVRAAGGSLRILRAPDALPDGGETGIQPSSSVSGLHARIAKGFDPRGILPGHWQEAWG